MKCVNEIIAFRLSRFSPRYLSPVGVIKTVLFRNYRHRLLGFLLVALIFLSSSVTRAADTYWNVPFGGWSDTIPCPWSLGTEPVWGDNAYITNGGTASITQAGETSGMIFLGDANTGTLEISGGTLKASTAVVGFSNTGAINHSTGTNTIYTLYVGGNAGINGTYTLNGAGQLASSYEYFGYYGAGTCTQTAGSNTNSDLFTMMYLGYDSSGRGTYDLSGSGVVSVREEYVGNSGTGTFIHSAGTNTCSFNLNLGYESNSYGSYDLHGTGQLSSNNEYIGYTGTGEFTHSAGTNTCTTYLYLAYDPNSSGTYNLSGTAQLSTSNQFIGYGGTGTFNQSGGTNSLAALYLGGSSGSAGVGTYNLTGGTLILHQIIRLSTASAFNFGGGTLQADANFTTTTPMKLTGDNGNANIDTAGRPITLSGNLSGPGGLNKLGSGILTLSGTNTFGGAVNLNGGLVNATALNKLGTGTALGFNGGGLQFEAAYDPSLRTMTFYAGGATLDTKGYNITMANAIGNGGTGGLTKLGVGKLTFNASNTYSGNTTVSAGTLEFVNGIAPSGTSLIDVQSGKAVFKTVSVNKSNLNINTAALATFEVVNGSHTVGAITGGGITQIDAGSSLSAASIFQNTLTVQSGAHVIIRPLPGGPLGDTIAHVPEPSLFILIAGTIFIAFCASARNLKGDR